MLGPGLGTAELIVIAVVALIVVGPKDLPVLLRKLGRFMGKVRAMATDFRASFDEMARQSELDDLRKEVEALRTGQLTEKWTQPVQETFADIDQTLRPASRPFAAAEPVPDWTDTLPPDSPDGMRALEVDQAVNVEAVETPRAARPFAPAEATLEPREA